ncbi:MAG: hypothetical protein JNK64_25050 [Myxococcales bacterium]|nr:hypothetical protein [Myxococcales bacterium]
MRRLLLLTAVTSAAATGCAFGDDPPHLGLDDVDAASPDAAVAPDARPPVDAGPDAPPVACTLVPQSGCAGGRACDVRADGTTACREITAAGVEDDACASAPQCAAGYSCVGTASGDSCLALCFGDGGCAPASGSRCVIQVLDGTGAAIPGARYCSQACAPRSGAGCPATWNCGVFDDAGGDYTRCLPAGSGTRGAACTDQLDCAIGHDCVSHGATTCERSCRVGVAADCTGGTTCYGFTNTPLVVASVEWGVCL